MNELYVVLIIMLIPVIIHIVSVIIIGNKRKAKNSANLSGFEVAKKILDGNGLIEAYIIESRETVTNHYDFKRNVLRLDGANFHGTDEASMVASSYFASHGVFMKKGKGNLIKIRSNLLNFLNFSSIIGYVIAFIGILIQDYDLMFFGSTLLVVVMGFYLLCLFEDFKVMKIACSELADYKVMSLKKSFNSLNVVNMLSYFSSMITAFGELKYIIKNMLDR